MEQFYNAPPAPQVTVKPDKAERKQIRHRYDLVALVLMINILIFNVFGRGGSLILYTCFGNIYDNDTLYTLFRCLVPIISETVAIMTGIKVLKPNIGQIVTRDGFGGGTVIKTLILGLGIQTAGSMLVNLISMALKSIGITENTASGSDITSLPANLIFGFYACLLGPVLEEVLYRGVLLQSMRKYNERFAIFLSALIFGLMHQNYKQCIVAFVLGIVLAVVTIKHGSILPAIFTHIIANTTGTISNLLLQYYAPDAYRAAMGGSLTADLSGIAPQGMLLILGIAFLRIAGALAALVLGIVILVKGGNMSRPTPAGKSRGLPVFVTSVPWWAVILVYLFLNFVLPFIKI